MAANLSPDYMNAEKAFKSAKTNEERIAAMEKMLSVIPKHKGTEKLQSDLKKRLAKLRIEGESKKGGSTFSYHIDKEGAAQIFIIGPPNSGKSLLMNMTTNSTPEVAEYPFTTRKATPGMMKFEDIQFQLIDSPPINKEFIEPWLPAIIRNAEVILLLFDINTADPIRDIDEVIEIMSQYKIALHPSDAKDPGFTIKKSILVATKIDLQESSELLEIVAENYRERWPVVGISLKTGLNLDVLKLKIFEILNIFRVYSKEPAKPADMKSPFIIPRGTNLLEFAQRVHKDFKEKLKFARIWSESKYEGQRVAKDYIINDKDIIELHI